MEVAEGIRKMLENHRFVEISSHLTASIGMVLFPKDGGTVKELITKADASLSYAKELGGNRIHTYHGEDLVLEKDTYTNGVERENPGGHPGRTPRTLVSTDFRPEG